MKFAVETNVACAMLCFSPMAHRANAELMTIKSNAKGLDVDEYSCIWEDRGRAINGSGQDVFTSVFEIVPFSPEIDSLVKVIERWELMAAIPAINC